MKFLVILNDFKVIRDLAELDKILREFIELKGF